MKPKYVIDLKTCIGCKRPVSAQVISASGKCKECAKIQLPKGIITVESQIREAA